MKIRLLGPDDGAVLDRVADGVFDHPVVPSLASEFLNDRRHHLIVAVDYVHPDKAPQLNAVELDPTFRTIQWPNGADFDPETLHDWPKYRDDLVAMARRWAAARVPAPRT